MRLIDAERVKVMLKKAAVHMMNGFPDSYDTGVSKGLIYAADIVNHAPTVDAVEVVRCRDCAKRGTRDCGFSFEHEFSGFEHWEMDDDYCRLGVRRADNDTR